MSDEKTEAQKPVVKPRGKSYPGATLQECVGFAETIARELGSGRPWDRDQIGKAIGYSATSGTGSVKIAALVHFGFLDLSAGQYSVTESVVKLTHPTTPNERENEIQEAFFRPKLYAEIIKDFASNGRIPAQLSNILRRNYGITDTSCDSAAKIFRESGRFAGVLDENLNIRTKFPATEMAVQPSSTLPDKTGELEPTVTPASTIEPQQGHQRYDVPLSHGRAILDLPAEMESSDMAIIKKLLELLELQVSLGRSNKQ